MKYIAMYIDTICRCKYMHDAAPSQWDLNHQVGVAGLIRWAAALGSARLQRLDEGQQFGRNRHADHTGRLNF